MPLDTACEINRLTFTNESDCEKVFDVFSYVEFCLWNAEDDSSNFQRNFSTGEVEVCGSRIYHKTEYRERRNHYAVFSVNRDLVGFDTSRGRFRRSLQGSLVSAGCDGRKEPQQYRTRMGSGGQPSPVRQPWPGGEHIHDLCAGFL